MSRFTQLTKVPFLEAMLKADIDPSHDFDKWIQEGKSVFIMIPQNLFPNPKTRDIITTYFMTRIWLTAQIREDNTKLANPVSYACMIKGAMQVATGMRLRVKLV